MMSGTAPLPSARQRRQRACRRQETTLKQPPFHSNGRVLYAAHSFWSDLSQGTAMRCGVISCERVDLLLEQCPLNE